MPANTRKQSENRLNNFKNLTVDVQKPPSPNVVKLKTEETSKSSPKPKQNTLQVSKASPNKKMSSNSPGIKAAKPEKEPMSAKLKILSQSKRTMPIAILKKESQKVGYGILNLVNVRISGTTNSIKTDSLVNNSMESKKSNERASMKNLIDVLEAHISGKTIKRKSARVIFDWINKLKIRFIVSNPFSD